MVFWFIAAAAAAISAVSTYKQMQQQKKQAKALNSAAEMKRRQELLQQAQERQKQVRQARIEQGRIQQASANQGSILSSAAMGGFGSVGSQRSNNLGYLNANSALAQAGSLFESAATKYGAQADMWAGIGNMANTVMGISMDKAGKTTSPKPTTKDDIIWNNQ